MAVYTTIVSPTTPSIRYVVGAGTAVDDVTTFASLHDALTLNPAGMAAGDIIQIEPGSNPGVLMPGNLSGYLANGEEAAYTIQGDPAYLLGQVPAFQVSSSETLAAPLTLNNVNVDLLSTATLTFQSDATISDSAFDVDWGGPSAALLFTPMSNNVEQTISHSTFDVIDVNSPLSTPSIQVSPSRAITGATVAFTDNTFEMSLDANYDSILLVNPAGPGTVLTFTSNTFRTSAPAFSLGGWAMVYDNTGLAVTVNDTVVNNTFIDDQLYILGNIDEEGPITGLSLQNNQFTGPCSEQGAIALGAGTQDTQVVGNCINETGGADPFLFTAGIAVTAGDDTTTSAFIANNQILIDGPSDFGVGLQINSGYAATDALNLRIQGNDFENDSLGVQISVYSETAPLAGIDLGGGSQNSLGGNDFRGDSTANAIPSMFPLVTQGAIGVSASYNLPMPLVLGISGQTPAPFPTPTTILARGNLFSGPPAEYILVQPPYVIVDVGPHTRYVVGPGTPIDDMTTFATLHDALTLDAADRSVGDGIQIEPGSNPGLLQPGDLSGYAVNGSEVAYTIQGDPAVALAQIPAFQVSGADILTAPLTLTNVNVDLTGNGDAAVLTFQSNVAINDASFTVANDDEQSSAGLTFSPTSNNVVQSISNSTVVNLNPIRNLNPLLNEPVVQVSPSPGIVGVTVTFTSDTFNNEVGMTREDLPPVLLQVQPAGPGAVLDVTGNTFQSAYGGADEIVYETASYSPVTVTDQVVGNTFLNSPSDFPFADFDEEGPITGLSIQNNIFRNSAVAAPAIAPAIQTQGQMIEVEGGSGPKDAAILFGGQGTQVTGNTIDMMGFGSTGIAIGAGVGGGTTTSALIANNSISTGGASNGGTGLVIYSGTSATDALNLQIQGNDLGNNQLGVYIQQPPYSAPFANGVPLSGIDLGGGSQGSLGNNDFRGAPPRTSTRAWVLDRAPSS